MIPPPVALGLVLCDHVHWEEGEPRKVSLIGSFDKLAVPAFPGGRSFYVYAAMTDGIGEVTITVVVENLETGDALSTRDIQVTFATRRTTVQMSLLIRDCLFPAPGGYQVRLLGNRQWVAQRRIEVYQREG